MRRAWSMLALLVFAAACSSSDSSTSAPRSESGEVTIPTVVAGTSVDFGPAPAVPTGDLDPAAATLLAELDASLSLGFSAITTSFDRSQLDELVAIGDARLLWLLADLMRFPLEGGVGNQDVIEAFETLSGVGIDVAPGDQPTSQDNPWTNASNRLIAWDLPAFPGYLDAKRGLFTTLEPQWATFFTPEADVDWRHVSWGGVLIDDRLVGDGEPCIRGCIPALDDPAVTPADEGDWYPDDAIVFGIEIDGEARAYPKNMMEIHEMVNDTLGGRRIAVPYCTLCGSAQAYLTDRQPTGSIEDDALPIMRTSGLLIRSNKMMFELRTRSLIDTFVGVATTGPLQGQRFEQVSVATSTWGEWKQAYPDTTILAQDGGIGRTYAADPLRGRDDDGPIFPIGPSDPRLPMQEPVLGIETAAGQSVAVHVEVARATLLGGQRLVVDGVEIELAGDGVRAVDRPSHQAFWFAWSQFRPDTLVWPTDF